MLAYAQFKLKPFVQLTLPWHCACVLRRRTLLCCLLLLVCRRILFCYSRDRAVPFSSVWVRVDPWTKSPVLAVWGVAVAAFCLGLPMLGSVTAFNAILSLSTISLLIIYVTPITARITWGRQYFTPGPFNLGRWAYPVGWVSTLWMIFAAVVFCLPTKMPVDADNLNYAAVAFLSTCAISIAMFCFPKYGAYRWFTGPWHTVDDVSSNAGTGKDMASKASASAGYSAASDDVRVAVDAPDKAWL